LYRKPRAYIDTLLKIVLYTVVLWHNVTKVLAYCKTHTELWTTETIGLSCYQTLLCQTQYLLRSISEHFKCYEESRRLVGAVLGVNNQVELV